MVEKKLVEVALVPVALMKVNLCSVVEPDTSRSPEELIVVVAVEPILSSEPVRLLAKRLVEVPEVPRKVERVVRPLETVRVPVKLARAEIVWPLINPEVMAPRVALPVLSEVEKRLVEEAVVEKKLVVVALVVVDWFAINPPVKVEEAVEIKPERKPRVVEVETP